MEPSLPARWIKKILGFLAGFALAVVAEALLLAIINSVTSHTFYPRGLGWIIAPFSAGVGGAVFLSTFQPSRLSLNLSSSRPSRLYVAAAASWLVIVLGFVFVAEPFGYYMRSDDWVTVFKWLFVPPVLVAVILRLFKWANRANNAETGAPLSGAHATDAHVSGRTSGADPVIVVSTQPPKREIEISGEELAQRLASLSSRIDQAKRSD